MPKNVVMLVGKLEESYCKVVGKNRITYFTLLCQREDETGYDEIECKASGTEAELFEKINVPGNVITVLGRLTSKKASEGNVKTGVTVAFLSKGDRFDVTEETDSEYMERVAFTYNFNQTDEEERSCQWTEAMCREYFNASKEERAYLRGRWGKPPLRE